MSIGLLRPGILFSLVLFAKSPLSGCILFTFELVRAVEVDHIVEVVREEVRASFANKLGSSSSGRLAETTINTVDMWII